MLCRCRRPNNFDALKKLYTDVFLACTDYIPLIVNVRCPGQPSREELARDTAKAVGRAAAAAASCWPRGAHSVA